jgi:hypothetical protein
MAVCYEDSWHREQWVITNTEYDVMANIAVSIMDIVTLHLPTHLNTTNCALQRTDYVLQVNT